MMKSWLETANMEDGSLTCLLAETREALLPITGCENMAPRKRYLHDQILLKVKIIIYSSTIL